MGLFQSINVSVNGCSTEIKKHCSCSCNYTNKPLLDLIGRGEVEERMVSTREAEREVMVYLVYH